MLKKNLSEQYQEAELGPKLKEAIKRHISLLLVRKVFKDLHSATQKQQNVLIERFFEFLLKLEEFGLLDKREVFQSLDTIFQCTPQNLMSEFFESMVEKFLKDPESLHKYPNQLNTIAKCCKEVMRNLSITNDTHFRGKVLSTVAQVLPLSHGSGLNKAGQYSTSSIQISLSNEDQASDEQYKAYKNFWTLQKYLAQPFKIYTPPTTQLDFEITQTNNDQELSQNLNGSTPLLSETNHSSKLDYITRSGGLAQKSKENSVNEDDQREEGQADDDVMQEVENNKVKTPLEQVLYQIKLVLNRFTEQPLQVDKSQAQIMSKYPKYLTMFSLLKLQTQDFVFRETFNLQVLILMKQLQQPINKEQKKHFVISPEELKLIQNIEAKILGMMKDDCSGTNLGKRLSMSDCLKNVLDKEEFWGKWKEANCYDFSKKASQKIAEKKRDQKGKDKLISREIRIRTTARDKNDKRHGQKMSKIFRQPQESLDDQGQPKHIKPVETPNLGQFAELLITDLDPENDIEEDYKNKHKKVFSWRFLRLIAFCYLYNFHGDPDQMKGFQKFEGNSETQANILYKKDKKHDIYAQPQEDTGLLQLENQTNGRELSVEDKLGGSLPDQPVNHVNGNGVSQLKRLATDQQA